VSAFLADGSALLSAQALQVTIVFAIVLALDVLITRKASLALRTALWAAFFVKLLIPPRLTSPVSTARIFERAQEFACPRLSSALHPRRPDSPARAR
jgi:hypothetical protein